MVSPAYNRIYQRWLKTGRTNFTNDNEFILDVRREISKDIEISNTVINLPKSVIPDEVAQEILKSGLVIVGGKGCGKSNAIKIIMSKIINKQILSDMIFRCKLFDTCANWRFKFENIPFIEVNERTDIYNYLLEGEMNDNILYDFQQDDVESIMQIVGESVRKDFKTNRIMKMMGGGVIPYWSIYCIEEAQNILGSYSLNKDTGKFWLKAISEGRNFNMTYIFIGQRLSDISTKVTERANGYLFGKSISDNDRNKIRRICGGETGIHKVVSSLDVGEFIYWNGEKAWKIKFDEYISQTKPYQIGGMSNE